MLTKKSIETGEDVDGLPESTRQILALQGLAPHKHFAHHMFNRPGAPLTQYGTGMLMTGDVNGTVKTGTWSERGLAGWPLTCSSHPTLHLSVIEHWLVASSRTERHGLGHLLFTG